MARGEPAEGDAQADGEEQGADRQLDREREPLGEGLRDGPVVDDARSEIALEELPEIVHVLDVERLVEPQGLMDLCDQLGRRVLAEDGDRRVAGQQPQEEEQDHGQAEQDRDRPQDPPDDEPQHGGEVPPLRYGPGIGEPGGLFADRVRADDEA